MSKTNWDDLFMNMVYLMASKSKDESTHIGAVIVGESNEVISTGYNSFPRGIDDGVVERQERPGKYPWFEHAERNSLYNAARIGVSTLGHKMYTNGVPCSSCARGVINSGIKEVIVDMGWNDGNWGGKWNEEAEISKVMFEEAGVSIRYMDFNVIDIHKFRRGKKIN